MKYKKIIYSVLIVTLFSSSDLKADKIHVLKEVVKPRMIAVNNKFVFVPDRFSVLIYDRQNLKLIKEFGREGQGPKFKTGRPLNSCFYPRN